MKLQTTLVVSFVAGDVKEKKKLSPTVVFQPEQVVCIFISQGQILL